MHPILKQSMSNLQAKQAKIGMELANFRQEMKGDLPTLPKSLVDVVKYIQQHLFDTELNVNTIKRECRLRDHNFSIRFRSVLGVSPREYIELMRMAAADRLLRDGEYEVYLVAMSVGYCHQETFFRAFQRHFGCPPSQRHSAPTSRKADKRSGENERVNWQEEIAIQP